VQLTDSEIMGRLINPDWTRFDEFSGHRRPSLRFIEEAAETLGVQPCEVFIRIANDVLSGETGSGHDLLVELLDWIIFATPSQRTQILEGYAANKKMHIDDQQGLLEQECKDPRCHGPLKVMIDGLRSLEADLSTAER